MTRHATVAWLIGSLSVSAHAPATPTHVPGPLVISELWFAWTSQSTATPTQVPAQLVIAEVSVDLTSQLITISGEHFGNAPAAVTLAGRPLTVVNQTDARIVAVLPAFAAAAPGTFLLTVTRGDQGPPARRYGEIDVTIGAAGPRGEPGPQGERGPIGPSGPQGEPGAQGPKGDKGDTGAPGLRWTGRWSASARYSQDDAVEHEGTSYVATADAFGVKPPSPPWQVLAARGLQGEKGEIGPQGPGGPQGEQGPVGPIGPQGSEGPQGSIGPIGPQGPQGPIGPVGPQGAQGPQGSIGPIGPQGPQGAIGPIGPMGPQGPKGDRGDIGPAGLRWRGMWSSDIQYLKDDAVEHDGTSYIATADALTVKPPSPPWQVLAARGLQGEKGDIGPQGPGGPQGEQGPIGPVGPQGVQGPQGSIGPVGPQGAIGPIGPIGPQGPKGDRGDIGPAGLRWKGTWRSDVEYLKDDAVEHDGTSYIATATTINVTPPSSPWEIVAAQGKQGDVGPQGPIGPRGPQGDPGAAGPIGPQGPQGVQGPTGPIGPTGAQGPKGDRGEVGPMGPQGPAGPVDNLGNHIATQTLNMNGQPIANASNIFASSLVDRDQSGFVVDPNGASNFNVSTANESYANGWFRVNGNGGIFWQPYGGGWNMTDGTWLRTFGNKPVLATGGVAGAGNAVFGSQYGASPRIFANFDNASGGGLAISDDGGFYDFNDGWVQFRGRNGLQIKTEDSESALTIDVNGVNGGVYDKAIAPTMNAWGKVGTSGRSWWEIWAYNFYAPSDERVKKDIEDIPRDDLRAMLDRLDKVRTVRFRYLDETATFDPQKPGKYRPTPRVGVIAQSLPDELVAGSDDQVKGIDVAQALGYAFATIKALREELRELKQEVEDLRGHDRQRD